MCVQYSAQFYHGVQVIIDLVKSGNIPSLKLPPIGAAMRSHQVSVGKIYPSLSQKPWYVTVDCSLSIPTTPLNISLSQHLLCFPRNHKSKNGGYLITLLQRAPLYEVRQGVFMWMD